MQTRRLACRWPPVHPHMRGDNVRGNAEHPGVGSPPHAWGQYWHRVKPAPARRQRFTPTCVGTMLLEASPQARRHAVHPHMRGDNGRTCAKRATALGSPPHAWGQCRQRAIAACRISVHPHMRGDNECEYSATEAGMRFTPTCVGTMLSQASYARAAAVHPHMRGDNLRSLSLRPRHRFTPTCVGTMCSHGSPRLTSTGSPPHAWGQCEYKS